MRIVITVILIMCINLILYYSFKKTTNQIQPLFSPSIANSKLLDNVQFNTNILIVSGYFGCSTVCPPLFENLISIGSYFTEHQLKIILLNTDLLIKPEDFNQECQNRFHGRVVCIYPDKEDFINFFRKIGLPLSITNIGYEHSSRAIFYNHSNHNFYLLQKLDINTLKNFIFSSNLELILKK